MQQNAFRHHPRSGETLWIDQPDAPHIARARTAETWLIEHFEEMRERGFTIVPQGLSLEICDEAIAAHQNWCRQHTDELETHRHPNGYPYRVTNLHIESDAVFRVFSHNWKALEVQDFLFGYRTSIYTNLFFSCGTEQPIHRDAPVFCTEPRNFYFGVWTALEDVHERNGNLLVVESGHRVPGPDVATIVRKFYSNLDAIPKTCDKLWNAYQNALLERCLKQGLSITPLPLRKGDTLIWHPSLPHGGAPVRDPASTRYSIVFHTVPEGTPVYQANVFFNPHRHVSDHSFFEYRRADDRLYADLGPARFGLN